MKRLILTLSVLGTCMYALPAAAQDMHHHVSCPHRHAHQYRAGTDHNGCAIYRYRHHQ